ncbi:class E basic helix-loop-helix protein 40-like [Paramormyrops kingsleyae]|uniref:Basic helix-loop-helix family member e40 n=1 Tax=Paramormyrops kingsleyae TaxID=1676925 RepID=A0A3B3QUP9_9TELE|nr:class E basic helix-loop-helix protein 40-like [Paramormyrops kingsleyae]
MERITSAQPPPCLVKHPSLEIPDIQGMDFPMYVYKSRRGMKRGEDSKETYKLPHRLIEKKRRDRINECIAQLKDLLPEHLKLTTLGHLEKAVVLELTLKHVKALTGLLEQQQQKIIALQNGMQIGEQSSPSTVNSEEMFRSGFHFCAKEILQYLANQEAGREVTSSHLISHLQKVASEVLQSSPSPHSEEPPHKGAEHRQKPAGMQPKVSEGHGQNCVPVIQRTNPQGSGEQSGSDTDTDSGYGGELEKTDSKTERPGYYTKDCHLQYTLAERMAGTIKQEMDEPQAKRLRAESSEDESLSSGEVISVHSSYMGFSPHQPPLCMPFYLIPPSAAAYLPMLEKCWYPGAMPVLYPGLSGSPEKLPQSFAVSPQVGSPMTPQSPMDSPALLQALKQVPPLSMETKD